VSGKQKLFQEPVLLPKCRIGLVKAQRKFSAQVVPVPFERGISVVSVS
jgi:hypothetical protein